MDYEKLSLFQAVRRWPRVTIYSACLALNILLWGYDTAIVGNVASMPAFQKTFGVRDPTRENQYIITATWLALWSLGLPIGTMIGAAAGGWIQDLTGRRWTLLIGSFLSAAAIATCYVSDLAPNVQAAFFGAKLVEGVAVGVIMCSTQTYLSEVVPARLRGPVQALFPIFQLLGQLVAAVVGLIELNAPGKTSYRIAIASEWPFSAIPLVLAFMLPESPSWLLSNDRTTDARNAFRKLHGATVAASHQDLFEDMHKAVSEERWAAQDRDATYIECFRGSNMRRTFIVVFANSIPELFGLTLLGHVSYFLQLIGLSHSASFIILILGVVLGLLSNIGSFWTLLKFGRRILTLITLAVVTVLWGTIGIAGCFSSTGVAWYSAAGMMAIVVSAGLGAWPASYVLAAETSSLRLRSKTSGVGWLMGGVVRCVFGTAFPFLYNSDALNLGAKTGFILFGTAAIGVVITWFIVPEMKGLSSVEIDRLFEKNISIRRAGTSEWERVGSGEELAERNMDTGDESTKYDNASVGDISIQPSTTVGSMEPLRKRPTF